MWRHIINSRFIARLHPDLDIFVLFSGEVGFFNNTPMPIVDAFMSYPNVHLNYFDILKYTDDTPMAEWFRKGELSTSTSIIQHTSDILRIITLWKYSGTYLDLDVILLKPLSTVGTNFACIQNDGMINSAILNLNSNTSVAKWITERNFQEVMDHFNGKSWTGNGPDVLSNLVKKICNTTDANLLRRYRCQGFDVLPREACYAIKAFDYWMFFNETHTEQVLNDTKYSFAVHFYNYLSGNTKLSTKSKTAYIKFAEQYCPKVIKASGEFF